MAHAKRYIVIAAVAAVIMATAAAVFFLWTPAPDGIVVGVTNLPDSLNPILEQNTSGLNANELLFDGLVNFEVDPNSGNLYSDLALAERIEQDPKTKKTYRVTLKEIAWHDGAKVTAEDVVFSWKAYVDPENKAPKREYLLSFIENVKEIDPRTVEIEFRKPIPPFRVYPVLTFKIIPSTYAGKKLSVNLRSGEAERKFATEPVGTGPFKMKSWEIGKWVSFDVNAGYFKRQPAATSVVIKKVIDPVLRLNEFRRGRLNLILETSPMDRANVEKIPGVHINQFEPYSFYQVAINAKSALFANVEARRALAASLDRAALVPGVTDRKDAVTINTGPFPSNIFSRNMPEYDLAPLSNPIPFDMKEAKSLASSGGIANRAAILLYPDSMGDFGAKLAEGIVKQYAAIGLTVEAKRTGDQVFRRLVFAEKGYDLALLYSDGFDNLFSSLGDWYRTNAVNNVYGIGDNDLDQLFDVWNSTVVTADWAAVTRKLNDKIMSLAPAVYLCTLQKDVYSRGLRDIAIGSDNPFLSAENWSLGI